ncbi:uncharacterized protein [Rutidosis leptorrhynchoides]|uniref:uncharacterized protein n=1 Tax=Rutidosis leptorrhynchoides TaxID=125765 RepID=UPI003A98EF42
MDYMFSSTNNEYHENNINSSQQDDQPPLFLQFPSPFLDHEMDTPTILPNFHHHNHLPTNETSNTNKTLKPKCVRKKRCAGKKDRHSKIHTAQGLRDRRMRLSVHTARKFFDLNDMLGFDKASKTIEWLFSKSQKAIDEITETLQPDDAIQTISKENDGFESPLSACENESAIEIADSAEKDENLDQIDDESSRKLLLMESYNPLVRESRSEARARARERTIIKNLEKPKNFFQQDPSNVEFNESRLGFPKNIDNPNIEDQSSSSSSCYPLEYSNTYHFLKQLHLDNNNTYMGNITTISSTNYSVFDYNKTIAEPPPPGWLNSRNTFFGFLGGWDDSQNSRTHESNDEIATNITRMDRMNGEIHNTGSTSRYASRNKAGFCYNSDHDHDELQILGCLRSPKLSARTSGDRIHG